jgi:hypothetical protein
VQAKINVAKVFVLHYKKLKQRAQDLSLRLKKLNIDAEWIEDEIDCPKELSKYYLPEKEAWYKKFARAYEPSFTPPDFYILKPDCISIAIKHISAWRKIVENNIAVSLIFEDDVIFEDDFVTRFNSYLAETPTDWDLVFIGSGCGLRIDKEDGKRVYKKSNPSTKCADSYLITYSAAKKILEGIAPFTLPVDHELNYWLHYYDLNVYWWEPPIARQGSQTGIYKSTLDLPQQRTSIACWLKKAIIKIFKARQ